MNFTALVIHHGLCRCRNVAFRIRPCDSFTKFSGCTRVVLITFSRYKEDPTIWAANKYSDGNPMTVHNLGTGPNLNWRFSSTAKERRNIGGARHSRSPLTSMLLRRKLFIYFFFFRFFTSTKRPKKRGGSADVILFPGPAILSVTLSALEHSHR